MGRERRWRTGDEGSSRWDLCCVSDCPLLASEKVMSHSTCSLSVCVLLNNSFIHSIKFYFSHVITKASPIICGWQFFNITFTNLFVPSIVLQKCHAHIMASLTSLQELRLLCASKDNVALSFTFSHQCSHQCIKWCKGSWKRAEVQTTATFTPESGQSVCEVGMTLLLPRWRL